MPDSIFTKGKSICFIITVALIFPSCYRKIKSYGAFTFVPVERKINPDDIALPPGYKIEAISSGLNYPTDITFDDQNQIYVTESGYAYGENFTTAKLLRIEKDGTSTPIVSDSSHMPWNGVMFFNGNFYIAEGGQRTGGSILRISPEGKKSYLISGLPSLGDHQINGPYIFNNYIYFGIGTATNSGIVGKDNFDFGWVKRFPQFHDIPCENIEVSGKNYVTRNFWNREKQFVSTGPFSPFGTPTRGGQSIPGKIPCSGAVIKIPLQGGEPELVAWGFRNPFGLTFHNNQLYVTDNGYDDRGSRPVWGSPDFLWKVEEKKWYGWPDYSAGRLLDPDKKILVKNPNDPPSPVAKLACHSSSCKFSFSGNEKFGYVNQAFIAQFGDMAPEVGKIYNHVGFKIVRVDVENGIITDFAVNKGKKNQPASKANKGGLERPVSAKFSPDGESLYIVDFGIMEVTKQGPAAKQNTGVIWKISRIQ
ncbi:MAG: PQQ-dependent sugar dehydrogenase [Cytophagaceae bacterium]